MPSIASRLVFSFVSTGSNPAMMRNFFVCGAHRVLRSSGTASLSSRAAMHGGSVAGICLKRPLLVLCPGIACLMHKNLPQRIASAREGEGSRRMTTGHGYMDSVGRTVDVPPFKGAPKTISYPLTELYRWFRTRYTLYRMSSGTEFVGLDFKDKEFLEMAENMYCETGSALINGEKRKLGTYLTQKMHKRLQRNLPDKSDKVTQRAKKRVRAIGSKIVQARIVHVTGPDKHKFAQVIVDITTPAGVTASGDEQQQQTAPCPLKKVLFTYPGSTTLCVEGHYQVNRIVFDRALHEGKAGVWRISEFLEQR